MTAHCRHLGFLFVYILYNIVDVEYLVVVTSQFGERLVNVFGYGKEKGKKYPSDEELIKLMQERRQEEFKKLKGSGQTDSGDQEKGPGKEDSPAQSEGTPKQTAPAKAE